MDERVCSTKPQPTDQDRLPPKRPRSVVVSSARFIVLLVGAIGYLLGLRAAMSSQPPAPVTVGFVQDMMAHHGQAVEIASWAKDRALDPEVRELAAEIESTASQQLETMRASLALLGAPEQPTGVRMAWMSVGAGNEHDHGGGVIPPGELESYAAAPSDAVMPGMATDEELRALRRAAGPQLDVFFLQLMLRHHESGEPMLDYGAQMAEVREVRDLGGQMLDLQAAEGTRLRALLAEHGAAPLAG